MNDVITRSHDSADPIRDTNARALEIKFIVDAERAAALIGWARTRLDRDPHGAGAHGDEYATSSVYFDTAEHDVLFRRGSYGVAKCRMRRDEAFSLDSQPCSKFRCSMQALGLAAALPASAPSRSPVSRVLDHSSFALPKMLEV